MRIKRIAIEFNRYIYEKFYNDKEWPKIDVYTKRTWCICLIERASDTTWNVYSCGSIYYNCTDEDLYMNVPEYFLDLFEDLVFLHSLPESWYEV